MPIWQNGSTLYNHVKVEAVSFGEVTKANLSPEVNIFLLDLTTIFHDDFLFVCF